MRLRAKSDWHKLCLTVSVSLTRKFFHIFKLLVRIGDEKSNRLVFLLEIKVLHFIYICFVYVVSEL